MGSLAFVHPQAACHMSELFFPSHSLSINTAFRDVKSIARVQHCRDLLHHSNLILEEMLTLKSYRGMANSMDGQNSVLSVVGPLSHSVASLRLMVKSLLSQQPWLHDPLCNELPWRQDQETQILDLISSSKLAFGILKHDGAVTPHPPVQRALDMVVDTLRKLGHEVIPTGKRHQSP